MWRVFDRYAPAGLHGNVRHLGHFRNFNHAYAVVIDVEPLDMNAVYLFGLANLYALNEFI